MRKTKEQKLKNKTPKTNKGITLIALVITIIVMLILVAVTISMAVNGGLFDYAGTAVGETQNAIDVEQQLANGKVQIDGKVYNSIEEYVNGTGDIVGVDGEIFTPLYTQTKEYKDENGDIAVIPKGFSVGKSDGINTIEEGLVIQDAKGNQFVWIPVEITETDTETNIASFYRSDWYNNERYTSLMDSTTYTEPYADGYEGEEEEYYDMVKSVYRNKGFYIGRYEAGSTTQRTEFEANGTTQMVVKRDAYPYNCVGWGASMSDYISDVIDSNNLNQGKGAVYLSKHLLDGQTTGATSTLCYRVMWDSLLDFIKNERVLTDGWIFGNNLDCEWTVDRQTAQFSYDYGKTWQKISDLEDKSLTNPNYTLLTTGAHDEFAVRNIYDLNGNCAEWLMQASLENGKWHRSCKYSSLGMYGGGATVYNEYRREVLENFRRILFQGSTVYKKLI